MKKIIGFGLLSCIKSISHVFYTGKFTWITPTPENPWSRTRLMVLLNHTSLYEPLYVQALSFPFLWDLVGRLNVPGADVTLRRPIVGKLWKLMLPNITSVTRRKDHSWQNYLNSIKSDSIVMIAPEGRMKRPGGLDKNGKPMTVKGGVADILENLSDGGMVLCLSGGLHHVQTPGQHLPRLFKPIHMNLAYIDIKEYKEQFKHMSPRERKLAITQDMQVRLETDCPKLPPMIGDNPK